MEKKIESNSTIDVVKHSQTFYEKPFPWQLPYYVEDTARQMIQLLFIPISHSSKSIFLKDKMPPCYIPQSQTFSLGPSASNMNSNDSFSSLFRYALPRPLDVSSDNSPAQIANLMPSAEFRTVGFDAIGLGLSLEPRGPVNNANSHRASQSTECGETSAAHM